MTTMQSFSRKENELLPRFRKQTNEAESTEDVRQGFFACIRELLLHASEGRIDSRIEEIGLLPDKTPPYFIADHICGREEFTELWRTSDLPQIVGRFAQLALAHYKHLEKKPRKTEAKIRM